MNTPSIITHLYFFNKVWIYPNIIKTPNISSSYFIHRSQYSPNKSQLFLFLPGRSGAMIPARWGQRSASLASFTFKNFNFIFHSTRSRRSHIMSEVTKEQIRQSIAAYSTLLKHTGRWWSAGSFSSHFWRYLLYEHQEQPDPHHADHRPDARCHRRVRYSNYDAGKRPVHHTSDNGNLFYEGGVSPMLKNLSKSMSDLGEMLTKIGGWAGITNEFQLLQLNFGG